MHTKQKKIVFLILFLNLSVILFAKDNMVPMIKTPFAIKGATWNKDGTTFAYAEGNNIVVRNSEEYTPRQTIITENGNIEFMKFTQSTSGEGLDQLATLTDQHILDIRILPYEEPINSVFLDYRQIPSALAFSYNGNYIATGTEDGDISLFFQNYITNKMTVRKLGPMNGVIRSIQFSKNNQYILVADDHDEMRIWNLISGECLSIFDYFSQSGVPVILSSDGEFIIAPIGPKTVGIHNINHHLLQEIEVDSEIVSIDLSTDDANLIILTEKNEFLFYNFETYEETGYIPEYNANPISCYSFNNATTKLLVGHTDGSIYVLNIEDVMLAPGEVPPTYFMIAADDPEALKKLLGIDDDTIVQVEGAKNDQVSFVRHKNEDVVEIDGGIASIDSPYAVALRLGAFYKNYRLKPPIYFGGGLTPFFSFPPKKFPNEYSNPIFGTLKPPLLMGISIFAPVGIYVFPFSNSIPMFVELDNGLTLLTYWNQVIGREGLLLPPHFSYTVELRVGFDYKNWKGYIHANYDTISKFSLGFGVGFNINLPIIEPKENTLDEKTESSD